MVSRIETGPSSLPKIANQIPVDKALPPPDVSPETHNFLLAAIQYNRNCQNIFDKIDPTVRNLIGIYFGTGVSIREIAALASLSKPTVRDRIIKGLALIWEHLPPTIQEAHPKKEVINIKDYTASPRFSKKRRKTAEDLWKDPKYRDKTVAGIQRRKGDPYFAFTMSQIGQARPPLMEGKNHTPATIEKIGTTIQEIWNERHGIGQTDDPLAKRNTLIFEWLRLSQLLGHSPSSTEITRLKRECETRFSTTMYKREFGAGSFSKARGILTCISSIQEFATVLLNNPLKVLKRSVLEKDVKTTYQEIMGELKSIFSAPSIEEVKERAQVLSGKIPDIKRGFNAKISEFDLGIGEDEKSMWIYAIEQNLLPKMLQGNMLTQQEIDLLGRYFEKGIIGEELNEAMLNKFTIAVANLS